MQNKNSAFIHFPMFVIHCTCSFKQVFFFFFQPKVLILFLFLQTNVYCGYSFNRRAQAFPTSTHNICFHDLGELKIIFTSYPLIYNYAYTKVHTGGCKGRPLICKTITQQEAIFSAKKFTKKLSGNSRWMNDLIKQVLTIWRI